MGDDSTLCVSQFAPIVSNNEDSTQLINLINPTTLNLTDDNFSPALPIGFNFEFFGTTYSTLCVGSNGVITFNATQYSNGPCPWSINSTLPSTSYPNTSIFPTYNDMNPGNPGNLGTVKYETIGTAPNRQFVVFFNSTTMYSCSNPCWSSVTVLYETSNEIDVYLRNKIICLGWNGGNAIQGLQNQNCSIGLTVPGRTYPIPWSASLDGKRWTPTSASTYDLTNVPFKAISYPNSTIYWSNTEGDIFPESDTLIAGYSLGNPIGYFMTASTPTICSGQQIPISDTSWLTNTPPSPYGFDVTPDYFGLSNGTISSQYQTVDSIFYWPAFAISSDSLTGLTAGVYNFNISDTNGCFYTDSVVIEMDTTILSTLVSPICTYSLNGSITLLPQFPEITYTWINPPSLIGNTISGLTAGNYSCIATSTAGYIDTLYFVLDPVSDLQLINPQITPVLCFGQAEGAFSVSIQSDIPIDLIEWNGQTSITTTFNNLVIGNYSLYVIDTNGCELFETVTIPGPTVLFDVVAITVDEISGNDGSVNLSVVSGDGMPFTYELNGMIQSSNVINNLDAGNYIAYVTDNYGCIDTVQFIINQASGLFEQNSANVQVFPNPTSNSITLMIPQSIFEFTIENLEGKILLSGQCKNSEVVNISKLSASTYVLRINTEDGTYHKLIVKE